MFVELRITLASGSELHGEVETAATLRHTLNPLRSNDRLLLRGQRITVQRTAEHSGNVALGYRRGRFQLPADASPMADLLGRASAERLASQLGRSVQVVVDSCRGRRSQSNSFDTNLL